MCAMRRRLQGIRPDRVLIPIRELERQVCQLSLKQFIMTFWHVVEPARELIWNWHHDVLCTILEQVSAGDITKKRVIINIPPGTSKSMIVSVFWPAWEWATKPHLRYITFSYSDALTIRDNQRCRDIVESDKYKYLFPEVQLTKRGEVKFVNNHRGHRIASSVEGRGTGEHAHRIVIDDPIKSLDADYLSALTTCNNWFDNTVTTRKALDPVIVLVMQRLHMLDLSAHLQDRLGWYSLVLPMEFEPDTAHPLDQRTTYGELLFPAVYSRALVDEMKLELGSYGTASQLQQKPSPPGGLMFKEEYFANNFIDESEIPLDCDWCRGWDIAETDEEAAITAKRKPDETVGVKIGKSRSTGKIIIAHVTRLRKTLVTPHIKATAQLDGINCAIREGSGSGKNVIADRLLHLAGYDYASMPETESKIARAKPFRAQCEGRNVYIVRGEWNRAYLYALCGFPTAAHDDDVDATSNGYNYLVQTKPKPSATFGKKHRQKQVDRYGIRGARGVRGYVTN